MAACSLLLLLLPWWLWGASSQSPQGPLDWLLSDKGPFHHSQSYLDFMEKNRQGFSTRYKIYREFGRWKVSNLVVERRDVMESPLPLTSEFIRNIRQLGRRPSCRMITDHLIRKYGTHFLLSATLGGEEALTIFVDKRRLRGTEASSAWSGNSSVSLESLHQLAASYFIDRESTLRTLHRLQITSSAVKVTETRTGPLGCSNYDNLDSVSSVLVQSPENKVQLQGLQVILPDYLREAFVRSALSYIACNGEGELLCRDGECWCQCHAGFPECNCPLQDLQALEESLQRIWGSWEAQHQDFRESDEFKSFQLRLPQSHFLNSTMLRDMWDTDLRLQRRFRQLESSSQALSRRARRLLHRLFSLSKRCQRQPRVRLLRERPRSYWLTLLQSLLYCSQNNQLGSFSEELRGCSCRFQPGSCQLPPPCSVGLGSSCSSCAAEDQTRCGGCNAGFALVQGSCQPAVADSTENYLGLESHMQDLELEHLLRRSDRRLEVHTIFISNDVRLNSWFDPAWRKRMLLTLRSNKSKSKQVHMLLGVSLQLCRTPNSTLEPALALYINPFGGSHSESWLMPLGRDRYPDWERTPLDLPFHCSNWTLRLGGRWKTFVETLHVHLRGRVTAQEAADHSPDDEPLEGNRGYVKIAGVQVFGYSMPFDPEAIRDLILQLDYPHTRGSQDSALLRLLEIRERVNRLSPPGPQRLDLFCCLLRHRLKLSSGEVGRIQGALRAFSSHLPGAVEDQSIKLCS
ncbi:BMP/retinoic acid-inducible neural-specific protein 3-like [Synchiropus splendidus]|uniref:BMP/retinoic acid-inducible neural-specific protein 3-like n=1 Tax=Synchiropus splendidus TaxID=270530 RepID=UPI00237D4606|nr:BMP/retinoic acid-inducible neural-specific protein 3-like [Synchiropus splendidus]XP_053720056.1 BMP/retinoic acid-inducible neural-specific protein 3-like [Synchiropus splendidus]